MKRSRWVYSVMYGCALALTGHQSFASVLDELSPADQDRVKKGELVAVYEDSGKLGAPWPICKVYMKMAASAQEAAAVFHDYAIQVNYVPNITKSEIVNVVSKTEVDVAYDMTLPMGFGVESYVAHDKLSTYDNGASYKVEWTVTPTLHIKESLGSARFESWGSESESESVIAYQSFIFPNRWGSNLGWVIEKAKQQVSDAVTAIGKKVESEKASEPEALKAQIQALHDALAP